MSLIFDRFKTEQDARRFIERVQQVRPGRGCQLFLDVDEAQENDPFPYALSPPIVHVDRVDDYDGEDEIRAVVSEFDGAVFAGT